MPRQLNPKQPENQWGAERSGPSLPMQIETFSRNGWVTSHGAVASQRTQGELLIFIFHSPWVLEISQFGKKPHAAFDFCQWTWFVLIRLFLLKTHRSIMSFISSFRPCLRSAPNSLKLFKNRHQRRFRICNFNLNRFTLISSEFNIVDI